MNCEKLFQRIDELQPEYVKFWEDVINLESPTEDKARVDACSAYYAEKARARGWQVVVHPIEGSGDIVAITMNPDAPGKPVVFSGHVDTVHPVGLFGTPAAHRDETYMYGPGCQDCKGGTVASFLAMAALDDIGFRGRPVKLVLQSDEENSSRTSGKATVRAMYEESKDCAVFLNTEGYKRNSTTVTRKGISKYRLTVTGKAVHASLCDTGISAITEAAHKVIELEKMKDPMGLTCNCGLFSGGTAVNAVPEKCTFTLDIRFRNKEQMEAADELVKKVAETSYIPGSTCEVELLSRRVAMEFTDTNRAVYEKVNAIYAEVGLPVMGTHMNKGGSDAADMTVYGVPTLDSLGTTGEFSHSIRERTELVSLAESARRLAAVAYCL